MSSAAISASSPPAPNPWLAAADILDPPRDEDRERAEQCRESLSAFVREAWPVIEPHDRFISGWHVDVICEHLEAVSAGELRRLIVNIPPRATKSLTVAVFWPAWEWLSRAYLRWLFASYSSGLSTDHSVKCRRLLESQGGMEEGGLLQRGGYRGLLSMLTDEPWELTGDQNLKTRFENTASGVRLATSVGSMATGTGGDRIVVDDPLKAGDARSDTYREAANDWWDQTMVSRFNNPQAVGVLVMQRLHERDLTGHLLERGGWHHLCLPAEYEPSHPFVYPERVTLPSGRELPGDPRTSEGELLEPERLGHETLDDAGRGKSSLNYAGQYQQRPAPPEGGMFKRGWWKRCKHKQLPTEWDKLIASWDMRFSDSQSEQSSYVVGQAWGTKDARRYLLAQVRARLSFTETLQAVLKLHEHVPGITATLVEDKANGPAVIDTLKQRVPGLLPVRPEGGKQVRAAAVTPLVEAGDVYLPASGLIPTPEGYEATSVDDLIAEHAVFPNGAHDDQVDALSQALNWLANAPGPPSTRRLRALK